MSDADRLHQFNEEHYAHDEALIATALRLADENEQLRLAIHKALVALRCPGGAKSGLAVFVLERAGA